MTPPDDYYISYTTTSNTTEFTDHIFYQTIYTPQYPPPPPSPQPTFFIHPEVYEYFRTHLYEALGVPSQEPAANLPKERCIYCKSLVEEEKIGEKTLMVCTECYRVQE